MGRDNQAEMTKPKFLIADTYSSPYHWLVDNSNQCTYLVGYLVSNGCNAWLGCLRIPHSILKIARNVYIYIYIYTYIPI
jgi:hypothetical protein